MVGRTFSFFPSNVGRKIGQTDHEPEKKNIAQKHWEERLIVAQYSVLGSFKSSKNYV